MAGNRSHPARSSRPSPALENEFLTYRTINGVHLPPRFLLGTALLFWGAMSDHPFIAIILALLIESAHWTRLRWNFNDTAYIRAWQISVLAAGTMALFIWLDGDRYTALPRLLGWLPALFMPMQFAQSFGLRDSVPLTTFSFFARQRQLRNERLGLKNSSLKFNFGNATLVACMVASTLGRRAETPFFLIGLVVLTGWAILASRQTRWPALVMALLIAAGIAIGGQFGFSYLYEKTAGYGGGNTENFRSPNVVDTAIGRLGEIKLSTEIKWRLRPIKGSAAPKLLRTASYDRYQLGKWRNDKPGGAAKDVDFTDLKTLELVEGDAYYLLRADADQRAIRPSLPRFNLRGAASSNTMLPLPGDAASVQNFGLDGIERNSLGTVRIFPKSSVVDGVILWQNEQSPEDDPRFPTTSTSGETARSLSDPPDFFIPDQERAVLRKIVRDLDLVSKLTVQEKLATLRSWFVQNFTYSRYLTIETFGTGDRDAPTAMSTFLTRERRGHCEYFATAATLLLREAGVPSRYAVGFAVMEHDPKRNEYVIRGEHGHAWSRVWDAKNATWIDFDPTPPGWLGMEINRKTNTQWLSDWFLRIREDFFLWRNEPRNRIGASIVMTSIGLIAAFIVGRRLWRSKHVVSVTHRAQGFSGEIPRTPLHDLEIPAKELLGPRPLGLPFSRWLLGLKASLTHPEQLDEAIQLHQRLRFDPSPPEAPPVERLQKLVDSIRASLKKV